MQMKVHYLQHVEFESIGAIDDWVHDRGHALSGTHLFRPADFPRPDDVDLLVVMGGPMNIYEHDVHPWLAPEKTFIRSVIDAGKGVLGICLGAQLAADALGAPVTKGAHPEIGWFPVTLTAEAATLAPVFGGFPQQFTAFHAHGDTFAIPAGAIGVASSAACANQAFAYDLGRVVGLQFHLESTPVLVARLIEHSAEQLARPHTEPWVQSPEQMLNPGAPYEACRTLLFSLLDRMVARLAA
jgi:GMP synthase (glutamine-hydrolysing)